VIWGCQQAPPPSPPTVVAKPTAKPKEILQIDATNFKEMQQDEKLRLKQDSLLIELEDPTELLVVLSRIDDLNTLSLANATLTDEVLQHLPKHLSTLSLRAIKNPLTSVQAQLLSKLRLTTIGFHQLTLDSTFLPNLKQKQCDSLHVRDCHIVELSKLQFFDLPFQHLKNIYLDGLELTDANFKTAKKEFWNCESLSLARNDLSDATVQELRVLRFLDFLDLDQNEQITGIGFEQWAPTKIGVLRLCKTGLNMAGLEAITKKLTLKYLDISGNKISSLPVGAMEKIKELKFSNNDQLRDQLHDEKVPINRFQIELE